MQNKQELILNYYRQGDSIRKISRELGINRKTVTKYVKAYDFQQKKLEQISDEAKSELIDDIVSQPTYNSQHRIKRKLTASLISLVEDYLEANTQKRHQGQRKQQLKKIDIYELLKEQGYDIGYTSICNLVVELEQINQEAFIRQCYEAGDVCEFDWGEVKINTSKGIEKYQLAVFTSAYSNYRYARLFKHQDTHSFQQSHTYFFKKINGVPKTLVYDNMKVAVKKFVGHTEKEATAGLLKLSMYYHFSFRFCNVRKGNEKGHVERSVEYIRRKAFARKDRFSSLAQANDYLEHICDSLNEKPKKENDGKTSSMLLQEEQAYLYPVKPMFECGEDHTFKVDKYSTITYKTCRYSVPEMYVGKFINSKVYPEKIICRDGEEKLCVHTRLNGLHKWSIRIEHYTQTLRRKPGAIAGSLAVTQIDSRLEQIHKKYYINREKEFIDLIEYIKIPSITIEKIELAIKHLNPVKTTDVTLDKIKIVCDRKHENTEMLYHGINEIDEMCYAQLKALTRLFPENNTLNREITEVI
jgi:transposase